MINISLQLMKKIKNNSKQTVNLFHYAQITRQEKPEIQDFLFFMKDYLELLMRR